MKKINIYIGSSEEDLREESLELKNFVHRMADDLAEKRYDVDIRPLPQEGEDFNDDDIRNSEMCFFLFNRSADDENERNFDFAYRVFKASNNGRPKVYVYFRKPEGKGSGDDSIDRLKEKIDKEYGHFYENFSELDTVKLRLLLNLKFQEMDYLPVDMKGDGLYLNGEKVVDIDKVGEFGNNRELKALKAELAEVEEKYLDMKPEYAKGGCSEEFYKEFENIKDKRSRLKEQLEELRKQIFELSLSLSRDSARGDMTLRMKMAYRLLEQGDTKGCLAVLDEEDLNGDYFARKKALQESEKRVQEEAKKNARNFIKEHKIAIDTLMTMYDKEGRFKEIKRRYEAIVAEAEEQEIEIDVILDYANYLSSHSDSEAAEKYYLKELKIRKRLVQSDSKRYKANLAVSYNNLALLYSNTQRTAKAKKYYLEALEILERLAETDPKQYEANLATSYNNLAILYSNTQRTAKAKKYYLKALKIFEQLAETDPKQYEAYLATSYNNLAFLYSKTRRTTEAEMYHLEALRIMERLAKSNPEQFGSGLATIYNNLALLYHKNQSTTEAEVYYYKALKINKLLAETDPKRYEPNLAQSYNNLANLYMNTQRTAESEVYHFEALEIWKRLAKIDPKQYEPYLAWSYNNLGILYKKTQRTAEAEKYLLKSLEIREKLQG